MFYTRLASWQLFLACFSSFAFGATHDLASWRTLQTTLVESCLDCHGPHDPEAGLDLTAHLENPQWMRDYRVWLLIRRRIAWGEMPPEQPAEWTTDQRHHVADEIRDQLRQAARAAPPDFSPTPMRRLSRFEYGHALRDVLYIPLDVSQDLPVDGGGGEGFDNAAETLFVSPLHAEKYFLAARQGVQYAAKTERARKHLFVAKPSPEITPHQAAEQILSPFLGRAYRHPPNADETAQALQVFDASWQTSAEFEGAILDAMVATIMSPHFLFVVEPASTEGTSRSLDGFELATRLALFLTASIPDEPLAAAAADGTLLKSEVLRAQVARMVAGEGFRHFAEDFTSQWLGTRLLVSDHRPDPNLFPEYDDELRVAMQEEPIFVMEEIARENQSILTLLDGNYTYLNRGLSEHYGIARDPTLNDRTVRVALPADSSRGGLVTMAGVLTSTSYPHRTSPVLRGKWVLDNLLGSPPHPPPPNIPPLDKPGSISEGLTLRARLLAHRADPVCAGCHQAMDAIGFGLEIFDATGRIRDIEAGQPIEMAGSLPGQVPLENIGSLRHWLRAHQDDFVRNLVLRMFGYALGRGLTSADYPDVELTVERLERSDYHALELFQGIAESRAFQSRGPSEPLLPN